MQAELQRLLDKQTITDLVGARYTRALDWLDLDALKDCFHADGYCDFGYFQGNAHEFCESVIQIQQASLHRWHYCFNVIVDVQGDEARVDLNSLAGGRSLKEDGTVWETFFGSRYVDKVTRVDGVWRIASRHVFIDFHQAGPQAEMQHAFPFAENINTSHPFYAVNGG